MLKKTITFIAAVFYFSCLLADTPGKAEMYSSTINFQGAKNISQYVFYWSMEGGADADTVAADISFSMLATRGAPYSYWFWGVNTVTKKSTDTIHFHNYYSPDYVIILNGVKNDSINYTQKELSNANNIVSEGNTDSIANKQLIADAKAIKRKHYVKVGGFVAAGVIALGVLIWFFVRRRKKKETEQDLQRLD